MCFFIAGIQPKRIVLEDHPRMCTKCGLYRARLKRVDHYLSLFFIPLFPVKRGTPFLECQACGILHNGFGKQDTDPITGPEGTCPSCGRPLESHYRFCPFCGTALPS
ncbi:MAG: zinc ribbon domain-containing protein [Deltaproteobacteria bacterium]|nr:zinc ribbon domain-containing protein [Deltaproteobacteria bacterium]